MSIDKRNNNFVFISFCILCPAFQADGIVKYDWKTTTYPILKVLMDNNINIIQLPCPESCFNTYNEGLSRKPAGLKKYDTENYHSHCASLCQDTIEKIKVMYSKGKIIKAIIGVENSPSCAVNYIYSNKGMLKRSGIFINALKGELQKNDITIPFIGLNRRSVKSSISKLYKIL